MSDPTPENSNINRRNFLKLSGAAVVATLLGKKAIDYINSSDPSEPENTPEISADKIENHIDQLASELNIDYPHAVVVNIPEPSRGQEKLLKYASVIAAPALAEPTPAGETAMLILLTAAAGIATVNALSNETPQIAFLDPNQHMQERRGVEIATLITSAVEAAFMSPDPNQFKKKILCQTAVGIIEGCDKAVFLATEIATGGKTRVAAVLFGHESASDQWKQITGLYYRRGKTGKTTLEHFVKWMEKKGYTGYDICPADFPNPPDLFSAP